MLQKIIILGTGGTIAGWASDPAQAHLYQAGQIGIESVWQDAKAQWPGFEVHTEQVAQIDSKDMSDGVWRDLLARTSHHLAQPDVAGVVIAHGTDTLEETAFFLAALLPTDKPVVLTGAMRAANAPEPDGPANLRSALSGVTQAGLRGVCVVFAGQVHAASHVQKVRAFELDAFSSAPAAPMGLITPAGYVGVKEAPRPMGPWPSVQQVLQTSEWPRVEWLNSHGGATPWLIRALMRADADAPVLRGVVVSATGAGTLHASLERALEDLSATGVEVWVSTRCAQSRLAAQALRKGMAVPWTAAQARVGLMLSLIIGGR